MDKDKQILAIFAVGYLVLLGVAAVAAPLVAPHSPTRQNVEVRFSPSSSTHLL